jgi:hypothetical protein
MRAGTELCRASMGSLKLMMFRLDMHKIYGMIGMEWNARYPGTLFWHPLLSLAFLFDLPLLSQFTAVVLVTQD